MKIIVGNIYGSYTFNAAAKTVTLTGLDASPQIQSILEITNVTQKKIIYLAEGGNGLGGSLTGNVLTLDFDTSAYSNTDALRIIYEYGLGVMPTSTVGTIGVSGSISNLGTTNVTTNHEIFRDSFTTVDLTGGWQVYVSSSSAAPSAVVSPTTVSSPHAGIVYQFTNGDILFTDGNVLSGNYGTLAKHPFAQLTDTWLLSRTSFTGPVRMLSGLTISQRLSYNEFSYENVGVDSNGNIIQDPTYIPVTLTSIQVTSANQLNIVTTATPHNLKAGDRFMITGVVGPSSAVSMNIGPAVVTTILSPTTFASVTSWVGLTLATGTYVGITNAGQVIKLELLDGAQLGYGTVFDGVTAGNAWSVSRDGTTNTSSQFIAWNPGNTQDTAVVPSPVFNFSQPYTYSYQPKGTFEMYGLRDYLSWATVDTDSVAAVRSSINRSQNIPSPAKTYKTRLRAKNLNAPKFIARVVLASKTASTTATITTDIPHGLAVNDQIIIAGQRDQANFASQATAVSVASIINTYQFTVVFGASATATSYGGFIARADSTSTNTTIINGSGNALNSLQITADGRLRLVNGSSFTNTVVGDVIWLTGMSDNAGSGTTGITNYGFLEGFYRVALFSTTTAELEPLQGQITAANSTGIYSTSTFVAGSGYVQGTYTNVPLTGGTGTGAIATITVSSGGAVSFINITSPGTGYVATDALSASAANLGGSGSGFSITVANIAAGPVASIYGIQAGSGYTSATYSTIGTTGGSGSGLTVTVVVTSGLIAGAAGVIGVTVVGAGTGYKAGDVITIPLANIGNTGTVAPTFIIYAVTPNANISGFLLKSSAIRAHYIRALDMTMDVVESHSGSSRNDLNHAVPVSLGGLTLPVSVGTFTATNVSMNVAQVGGTNTVNGGVAGIMAVGGNIGNGTAPTANPVYVAGLDSNGLTRSIRTDVAGGINGPGEILYPGWLFTAGAAVPVEGTNSRTMVAIAGRDCELELGLTTQGNAANTIQVEGSWDNNIYNVIPMSRIDNFAAAQNYAYLNAWTPQSGSTFKGRTYGYPFIRVHETALTTTGTTVGVVRIIPIREQPGELISPFTLDAQNTTETIGTSGGVLMSGGVRTLPINTKGSAKAILDLDAFTYATGIPTASSLVLEGSQGGVFSALPLTPTIGGPTVTAITGLGNLNIFMSGRWEADVTGMTSVRVRWLSFTAGAATSARYHGALRVIPVPGMTAFKPTYQYSQSGISAISGANVLAIEAGATKATTIKRLTVTSGTFTTAAITQLTVQRETTAGVNNSVTIDNTFNRDPGDALFSGIVRSNNLTPGATVTTKQSWDIPVPATGSLPTITTIDLTNNNNEKGLVIPAGVANGAVFVFGGATGGAGFGIRAEWTEE